MKRVFLIAAVLVLAGAQILSAKSWRVNNNDNTANFQTLDAAMTSITAGDTLYLEGSSKVYFFTNKVTKKVTIIGPGYFLNENPNTLTSPLSAIIDTNTIYLGAEGITIEGVVFNKSIYIEANNVTVKRCQFGWMSFTKNGDNMIKNAAILQNYSFGRVVGGNAVTNSMIINNIFAENTSVINGCHNTIIENNTCVSGFSINGNSECTIKNNIINTLANNTNSVESNNYAAQTADFISPTGASTDGKWQLAANSQAMTAGSNGSQVGAFGGSSPYVLSGMPGVPHIYEIEAPTTASKESGLNIVIKIGTEK